MHDPKVDRPAKPHGDPDGFLIQQRPDRCRECWACVRYCPAKAIRVVEGRPSIIRQKCVKCGSCVSECGNGVHVVRDDVPAVEALLSTGRPVVAVLASEFVAAMYPVATAALEAEMEALGFFAVETTVLGEEMVAAAYDRLHSRETPFVLRSTCPVTTAWVQRYHPGLSPALAPLVPPYIAQARLVKKLYPEDTAVVYVSPCHARKDEIREGQFERAVDAAIDFLELRRLIDRHPSAGVTPSPPRARRPSVTKESSLTDGFPRKAVELSLLNDDVHVVRGLQQLEALLQAIEHGEVAPPVVDMLSCEGCIDGPAVNPGMSVFSKRRIVTSESENRAGTSIGGKTVLKYLPALDLRRSFRPEAVVLPAPTEEEIDSALAEAEFENRNDTLDCGACGHRTCVDQATAVLRGESSWELCLVYQRKLLARCSTDLAGTSMIDPLTNVWNRRAFEQRLEQEVHRARRYAEPLSILMLDLDGFRAVNDRFGQEAGDRVLQAVGKTLDDGLRATDMAARLGGDEFAVILPRTDLDKARRVALKLRKLLGSLTFAFRHGGYDEDVRVRVSSGVATLADGRSDPSELLETAGSAVYAAKHAGGDAVGSSPEGAVPEE